MTIKPSPQAPSGSPVRPGETVPRVRDGDVTSATFGYLGAIFLGPVIPLIVYAIMARRSSFVRYHAATAANLSISCALYGLCCAIVGGLLALDSVTVGLVVGVTLIFALWVTMLRYLIRGVAAANRGDRNEIPGWICARILT
jgi:uncharacterized Tic20 family protein